MSLTTVHFHPKIEIQRGRPIFSSKMKNDLYDQLWLKFQKILLQNKNFEISKVTLMAFD